MHACMHACAQVTCRWVTSRVRHVDVAACGRRYDASCRRRVRWHPLMHACIHTCMHAYIRTRMHTCMHACMHACMHTCTHAHTCTHVRTCTHAYIHTGALAPKLRRFRRGGGAAYSTAQDLASQVDVSSGGEAAGLEMNMCTHARMHTCTHAHCTHARMHTCTHAHMRMHIHAYTCIYTHTHTHTGLRG